MAIKRFKLFLASDLKKEEQWLTDMSQQGLHFSKYKLFTYYFDEDPEESYIYQIDFREAKEENEYLQLFQDSGWQHVDSFINRFHYFRTDAKKQGVKKIYSDHESVKETYQRMMAFYLVMFLVLITSLMGIFLTWDGLLLQKIVASFVGLVMLLYIYLFIGLKLKIDSFRKHNDLI